MIGLWISEQGKKDMLSVNNIIIINPKKFNFLIIGLKTNINKYSKENDKRNSPKPGIALKKKIACEMVAVDISASALAVAHENALNNNVNIDFRLGNLLEPLDGKVDILVSNPPYIAYDEEIMEIVKNNEPHLALYADNNGLYYYEEILKNVKNYLNDNYLIAFEIGATQGEALKELAKKYLNKEAIVEKDIEGRNRFVFIK